jgi:hypothetical protein
MQLGILENPEKIQQSDSLPQLFIESCEIEIGSKYYWEQNGQIYAHIMDLIDTDAVKACYSMLLRKDEEVRLLDS